MLDRSEVERTYEVESRFEFEMPTRILLIADAREWLGSICEREDLDPPIIESVRLGANIEAVAIAETWCILVRDIAPTQHTVLHELAHLSCANRGHGREFRTQLVTYLRRYISLEHAAHLHSLFKNAELSIDPFSATR